VGKLIVEESTVQKKHVMLSSIMVKWLVSEYQREKSWLEIRISDPRTKFERLSVTCRNENKAEAQRVEILL